MLLKSDQGAPLFLQFKEATTSVLEPYADPSGYERAVERVVRGSSSCRPPARWCSDDPTSTPRTAAPSISTCGNSGAAKDQPKWTRWARSGSTPCAAPWSRPCARPCTHGDGAAIHGYLGDDDTADAVFANFTERYADRNQLDHAVRSMFDAPDGSSVPGRRRRPDPRRREWSPCARTRRPTQRGRAESPDHDCVAGEAQRADPEHAGDERSVDVPRDDAREQRTRGGDRR